MMDKVDEILQWVNPIAPKTMSKAKQALAKLFHECVPRKKRKGRKGTINDWICEPTAERKAYNVAIDQTHKNIDEMFK